MELLMLLIFILTVNLAVYMMGGYNDLIKRHYELKRVRDEWRKKNDTK